MSLSQLQAKLKLQRKEINSDEAPLSPPDRNLKDSKPLEYQQIGESNSELTPFMNFDISKKSKENKENKGVKNVFEPINIDHILNELSSLEQVKKNTKNKRINIEKEIVKRHFKKKTKNIEIQTVLNDQLSADIYDNLQIQLKSKDDYISTLEEQLNSLKIENANLKSIIQNLKAMKDASLKVIF